MPNLFSHSRVGGSHTDPNLLTILSQRKVGGLQVCKSGKWIFVKPNLDTLIINIGDTFEVQAWTNGRFQSVEHRAAVNKSEARMLMVYFASPPAKATIEIPEQLITPKQVFLHAHIQGFVHTAPTLLALLIPLKMCR